MLLEEEKKLLSAVPNTTLTHMIRQAWDTSFGSSGGSMAEQKHGYMLRPSQLRVVQDGAQLDAQKWRVTVWLEKDGATISSIEQEVEVGLPEGCPHGEGLEDALHYGLNSKQVAWQKIGGTTYNDFGDVYKIAADGTRIPYPQN